MRYLDPKTSRWLSTDPALAEYIPASGKGSEGLPGLGGVYNTINLHLYHYAGNNPIKYADPTGREIDNIATLEYRSDRDIENIQTSEWNSIRDKIDGNPFITLSDGSTTTQGTPESDRALIEKNAEIMRANMWNLAFFNEKVRTGGDWDFKNLKNPNYKENYYWLDGSLVSAEEFGNLHYGYVGAAGGIPLDLLVDAPGPSQIAANTTAFKFIFTNFDDPRDTANIIKGASAYKGDFFNFAARMFGRSLYHKTGARNVFRLCTTVYFFSK